MLLALRVCLEAKVTHISADPNHLLTLDIFPRGERGQAFTSPVVPRPVSVKTTVLWPPAAFHSGFLDGGGKIGTSNPPHVGDFGLSLEDGSLVLANGREAAGKFLRLSGAMGIDNCP